MYHTHSGIMYEERERNRSISETKMLENFPKLSGAILQIQETPRTLSRISKELCISILYLNV